MADKTSSLPFIPLMDEAVAIAWETFRSKPWRKLRLDQRASTLYEIADTIWRINRETSISVILVEQNAGLALTMAKHAYVFEQGTVVRSGTGAALLADPFGRKACLGI